MWSGIHKKAKVACAVKIVLKEKLDEMPVYRDLMMDELKVLEDTEHPHIPRIFALFEAR